MVQDSRLSACFWIHFKKTSTMLLLDEYQIPYQNSQAQLKAIVCSLENSGKHGSRALSTVTISCSRESVSPKKLIPQEPKEHVAHLLRGAQQTAQPSHTECAVTPSKPEMCIFCRILSFLSPLIAGSCCQLDLAFQHLANSVRFVSPVMILTIQAGCVFSPCTLSRLIYVPFLKIHLCQFQQRLK